MSMTDKAGNSPANNSIIRHGAILAGAGLITKVIGFIYRIPMANLLGEEGNGVYSVAFGIYNIALTLSSYSLPLSVSKLVSERLSMGRERGALRLFMCSVVFAIVAGGIACGALFLGADSLERIYNCPGLAYPLRILAPTTYIVAFLGVLRGFFQGYGNMVPTAKSQIIEQIVNAIVSVAAAWYLTMIFSGSPDMHARGASGGTMGTLAGAAAALVVLLMTFARELSILKERLAAERLESSELADVAVEADQYGPKRGTPREVFFARIKSRLEDGEKVSHLFTCLLMTIFPVILSQTIYQISYTFDDLIFGYIMVSKGVSPANTSALRGVFNTQYNQLINLPVAIATAMAASTIPGIARARSKNDPTDVKAKADSVLKVNIAIAAPAAFGMSILADPIISVLFPNLVSFHAIAVNLLRWGSAAIVFYALSTLSTAIIQGMDHMRIPLIHSGISLIVHVFLLYYMLQSTDSGVYSLLICNMIFPAMVSGMNLFYLSRRIGYHVDIFSMLSKPAAASLAMTAVCAGCLFVTGLFTRSPYLLLLLPLLVSGSVYGLIILGCGYFSEDELRQIPLGGRLLSVSNRIFKRK